MKPAIHDASARQHSGGPSPVRGRSGNRDDRARKPGPGRGRTRNRRVARLVDRRAAACLAPTASRGTAGGSQPRPAHPSHGGASAALRRRLQSLAEAPDKGALAVNRGIVLKAGTTTLVRQWRGHTHTVLVQKDGFEHEGQRYPLADGHRRADYRGALVGPAVLWPEQASTRLAPRGDQSMRGRPATARVGKEPSAARSIPANPPRRARARIQFAAGAARGL